MKIVVTGGAGFIGSNFVKLFKSGEFSRISAIKVIDILTYAGNLKNISTNIKNHDISFKKISICEEKKLIKELQGYDAVINFAAESHVDKSISNPKVFLDTNIIGVHKLLEYLKGGVFGRLVQISTDEVYGSIQYGNANEEANLKPNSPYSASKASSDLIVRSYFETYKTDSVITRSSNNYGPYQHPEKLIPNFITKLLKREKIPVYGDGSNIREWIHVSDNCRGIYLALINGIAGEIYNLGSGNELTNMELTKLILNSMGFNESYIEFVTDRPGHDFRYSLDSNKSRKELGFKPSIDFSYGLNETINWYEENRNWWSPLVRS